MTALVKVNSFGFLFLWFTIIFICYHGIHAIFSDDISSSLTTAVAQTSWVNETVTAIGGERSDLADPHVLPFFH